MDSRGHLDLSVYNISSQTGFLTSSPLTVLRGDYFTSWENVLSRLPDLIKQKRLREEIDRLPELEFSECTLKTDAEWQRACLLLAFLGQGYIWMEGENGVLGVVPRKIAVPWVAVSQHIGLEPVGTYAATVLYNYTLRDPNGAIEMDNVHAIQTFTGTKDESWFYMVHVLVELAAVPALNAMARVFGDMASRDNAAVSSCLKILQKSLSDMRNAVNRMYDGCHPKTFFVKLRPFFAGSQDLKDFPDGLIYEGVDSEPKKYFGASAGESSIIYAFDMFVGTKLSGKKESAFVEAMRDYMPRKHREFLLKLRGMPSIRDYCKESGSVEVMADFNGVIDELVSFRNNHNIIVVRYIINQKEHSINPTLDNVGTGGTTFDFLKKIRDDTESLKIKLPPQ